MNIIKLETCLEIVSTVLALTIALAYRLSSLYPRSGCEVEFVGIEDEKSALSILLSEMGP